MKNFNFLVIAIFCSSFCITSCSSAKSVNNTSEAVMTAVSGEKHQLLLNPKVGEAGKMVITINMDLNMEVMGQSMLTKQEVEMATNMKVLVNSASEVKTSVKYDYFSMSMDVPMMGKMEYDTRKETNEGMLAASMDEVFSPLMKEEMTIVQDHSGKTIKIEGMESLANAQQSQGSFNVNSVIKISQFPSKPVAIGESWTSTVDDESSPMAFASTYTLKSISNGKVYIDVVSDVSSNKNYKGESASSDVKGKQTGTLVFNEKTMWLIEGLMNQDIKMKVDQMGMQIPMTMKSEIVMNME